MKTSLNEAKYLAELFLQLAEKRTAITKAIVYGGAKRQNIQTLREELASLHVEIKAIQEHTKRRDR